MLNKNDWKRVILKWIKENSKLLLTFFIVLILVAIPGILKWIRENSKLLLTLFTSLIVLANLVMVWYTFRSNQRADRLFIGQNKPLIDITPISISPDESEKKEKMVTTRFSVVNYSGFVAKNIRIDADYGEDNIWLSEWVKADRDNKGEKKGVVKGKSFLSAPKVLIQELKPGITEGKTAFVCGSLDLEESVCKAGHVGYPVLVRVMWENEGGHVFDEVHKYELVCTPVDSGRAFTFIPKGIKSKKD